jgi:phospholipid N-methyltransferase
MNYLLKLYKTGAVSKTPDNIVNRIVSELHTNESKVNIIELGAGKGEITSQVLQKLGQNRTLDYYAFEIDEEACTYLKLEFPQVKISNQSAFDIAHETPQNFKADFIISSIPLSFYKKEKIEELLMGLERKLREGGKIIILFSAVWLIPTLKKQLRGRLVSFLTFPPYFLFVYTKK